MRLERFRRARVGWKDFVMKVGPQFSSERRAAFGGRRALLAGKQVSQNTAFMSLRQNISVALFVLGTLMSC